MQRYEYRVVPAPARGEKAKGVKTADDRFAHALARAMNEMAAEGWEYQRAETLPCSESRGFFSSGTTTVYRSMLVFRRALPEADVTEALPAAQPAAPPLTAPAVATEPQPAAAPQATAPQPAPHPAPQQAPQPAAAQPVTPVRRRLMAAFAEPEAPAPRPVAPAPVLRAEREEPARGSRRLNLAAPVNGSGDVRAAVFRLPQGGRGAQPGTGGPPRSVPRGD